MDWVKNNIRRLHELLERRGWKRHDAEDVIQDAFLRMQAYCNEGGEVRNSEAFLVRTALNVSSNVRTRRRDHIHLDDAANEPALLLNLAPAPEEEIAAEEVLRQVSALIESMNARTREIFLLHYIDGYSYPQIATQLGISVSAIEKHMARAMLALTQELRDER
ncbi:MAG: RNA polymerase sigma factor [Gammaproteobacteria bacterium]